MIVIPSVSALQDWSKLAKKQGQVVALVPTMGFLHEGHLSLIRTARKNGADKIVVSVFVNPIQFGPNEDFDRYPRDVKHDTELCENEGVDVLFTPNVKDMYPEPNTCWVHELQVSQGLCATTRPTHFRGVTTVVAKLFLAAMPDFAVFGQKDAQQAAVIKRMVRDLNFPVKIIVSPIVREPDGLAMSSRNKYLSPQNRAAALAISKSLFRAADILKKNPALSPLSLIPEIAKTIAEAGGKIDYVEARCADTLQPLPQDNPRPGAIIFLVAAYFGPTRLIDNVII